MKQNINIKLLLGYFRASVQFLFLPPSFLWSLELNPPDAPGLEPQRCSFPGSKATKAQQEKSGLRSSPWPMCLVAAGLPSAFCLKDCQAAARACQQACPQACYCPAPLATSAGSLRGGTGPQASQANGRDPSPDGLVIMLHINVLHSSSDIRMTSDLSQC